MLPPSSARSGIGSLFLAASVGRPFFAVDRAKQKRISRGALAWLRMLDNPDILFRFDVVEVIIAGDTKPRVELIKNAFPLSKPYLY